jgi:excisionase family DNA binding protein
MNTGHRHLLNASEAAKYLGISLYILNRAQKVRLLKPYRTPGGHRRYSRAMLDEYLERSRENWAKQK